MKPKGKIGGASLPPLQGVWDTSWVLKGVEVWVELPVKETGTAFAQGTVNTWDENTKFATIDYKDDKGTGPTSARIDQFFQVGPPGPPKPDLVDIECLNDAELLNALLVRYEKKDIFTYCGPTLIIMNPFEYIPSLYAENVLNDFVNNAALAPSFQLNDKQPHVWGTSALTYFQLFSNQKKQAICISGESGAGKTINTKSCMQFLTFLSSDPTVKIEKGKRIEDKILGCNPILEAFGNSTTMRNDNSSRFGKYVALIVQIKKLKDDSKIIGATIQNYLLEKSRVVGQALQERNYHVFYAFMYGSNEAQLKKYKLENNPEKYDYMKKSKRYKVATVDDLEFYNDMLKSYVSMDFTQDEIDGIWSVVSSVLNLGNVQFDDEKYDGTKPCVIQEKTRPYFKNACEMLGMNEQDLDMAVRHKLWGVGAEKKSFKPEDKKGCENFRDSLAKDLFERVFNWLVLKMNLSILPAGDHAMGNVQHKDRRTIGLLDIFGFEILTTNSLEQFCINYTNENLQKLYIDYVFKAELKIFDEENLGEYTKQLSFEDNNEVLELMVSEKPSTKSIVSLLNEATRTGGPEPNKNDEKFLGSLTTFFKNHAKFKLVLTKKECYTIVHTAKTVDYSCYGFTEKNKDSLSDPLIDCWVKSSKKMIIRFYKKILSDEDSPEEDSAGGGKFLSLKFKSQMDNLMEELNSCDCNFIRCLKPNEEKVAFKQDAALTLRQIKYLGILDSIKIRKTSYPNRKDYKNFYRRYIDLDPEGSRKPFKKHELEGADWEALSKNVIKCALPEADTSQVLYGKTKVFMRMESFIKLEKLFQEKLQRKKGAVEVLEGFIKFYKLKTLLQESVMQTLKLNKFLKELIKGFSSKYQYRKFRMLRIVTRRCQQRFRLRCFLRKLRKKIKSAKVIKSAFESEIQVTTLQKKLSAAKAINRLWRGALGRSALRLRYQMKSEAYRIFDTAWISIMELIKKESALMIQRVWKGYRVRQEHKDEVQTIKVKKQDFISQKSAKLIQKHVRRYIVQLHYQRLKAATMYIQGYFFMKWLSGAFQKLRVSTRKIQRLMRKTLVRKHQQAKILEVYMEKEGFVLEELQNLEKGFLIGGLSPQKRSKKGAAVEQGTSLTPDSDTLIPNKLALWSMIIDIEYIVDVSSAYNPLWSQNFKHLCTESRKINSEIQLLGVGACHTFAGSDTNRVYSWGVNDYFQLGRENSSTKKEKKTLNNATESQSVKMVPLPQFPQSRSETPLPIRMKMFSCGEDHNLMLDKEGNLFAFGRNDKGQLGISNFKSTSGVFYHEEMSSWQKIASVHAKGNQNLAISVDGSAFFWPYCIAGQKWINRPVRLNFPERVLVSSASMGVDFCGLVTTGGFVYTFGKNSEGELGLGDTKERLFPCLVEVLRHNKHLITSLSCGYKHVIAKTCSGKVFTWGWGARGQLGLGGTNSEVVPNQVKFAPTVVRNKALQVAAGSKCSVVLTEDLSLLWWGSNASIKQQLGPTLLNRSELSSENFSPVRIMTSWSKTMSLIYVTVADSRVFNQSRSIRDKVLSHLATKWEETQYSVDTPFIESISRYFSTKNMSQTTREPQNLKEKNSVPSKCPLPELVDVLTLVSELQKAEEKTKKPQQKGKAKNAFSFDLAAIDKFQSLVEKKWGIPIVGREDNSKGERETVGLQLAVDEESLLFTNKENKEIKGPQSQARSKLLFNIPANMEKLHDGQKSTDKNGSVQKTSSPKKVRGTREDQGIAASLQNEIEM